MPVCEGVSQPAFRPGRWLILKKGPKQIFLRLLRKLAAHLAENITDTEVWLALLISGCIVGGYVAKLTNVHFLKYFMKEPVLYEKP